MRRLALFSFYSRTGSVNSFVYYYLRRLFAAADVVFIANGSLGPDAQARLGKEGYEICLRENRGFDFGAWKDFLLSKDDAFLMQYDELILCNCSCYGPVYPFTEIFAEMESRACDFWGLYRHPGTKDRKHSIPPHIQSYFLVIRDRMLHDERFRRYFSEQSYASSWEDAVSQETSFTAFFTGKGFVSESFLGSELSGYIEDPTIFMPAELIRMRFPLIKRKCFTAGYSYINKISSSYQIRELLDCIGESSDYPVDLIYEDLLESEENSHLIKSLGLWYVLESRHDFGIAGEKAPGICSVLFSSHPDRIPACIHYLNSLPDGSSVFVAASSAGVKEKWASELPHLRNFRVEVRQQDGNDGREASIRSICHDVAGSCDYICLINDAEDFSSDPPVKDLFFTRHCLSGLLYSREYVSNVIGLFQKHERLGLLMPFMPAFAGWPDRMLNQEWSGCREAAERIYSLLQLSVPFDDHPIFPCGGMFWMRSRAMEDFFTDSSQAGSLFSSGADMAGDGLQDAIDRMYPMIAQESGFFSGCICPSELAGFEYAGICSNLQKYGTFRIASGVVHFSDIKKIISLYLKRKFGWNKKS